MLPSVEAAAKNPIPTMPKRASGKWSETMKKWWERTWRSPMASQWIEADFQGIVLLLQLHQLAEETTDFSKLIKLQDAIKKQELRFGLSPADRKQHNWEITKDTVPEPPEPEGPEPEGDFEPVNHPPAPAKQKSTPSRKSDPRRSLS